MIKEAKEAEAVTSKIVFTPVIQDVSRSLAPSLPHIYMPALFNISTPLLLLHLAPHLSALLFLN